MFNKSIEFIEWLCRNVKDSEGKACSPESATILSDRVLSDHYIKHSEIHPLSIDGFIAADLESFMLADPSKISELWQEELDSLRFSKVMTPA